VSGNRCHEPGAHTHAQLRMHIMSVSVTHATHRWVVFASRAVWAEADGQASRPNGVDRSTPQRISQLLLALIM
jgi:hypothetical protein